MTADEQWMCSRASSIIICISFVVLGYRGYVVTDHSTFNTRTKVILKDSNIDLEIYLFDACKFDSNLRPSTLKKHET